MAVIITSGTPNLTDTASSINVGFSGATTGTNIITQAHLRVNGTSVANAQSSSSSGTITITITSAVRESIYNNATGSSLTGAISVYVLNFRTSDGTIYGSDTKTGGTLTIAARLTNPNNTTTPDPYNLDNFDGTSTYNWRATWSRPHTAFRGRVKIYAHNTLIATYSGFTTSINRTPSTAEKDAMIAAMDGVSPRNLYYVIETGFVANTTVYYTGGAIQTGNRSMTYTFAQPSTISISNFTLSSSTTAVPFTLSIPTSGASHTVRLYAAGTLIQTHTGITASGNFTIGSTERNIILNAMPSSTTATTYATVETFVGGSKVGDTQSSANVATNVTLHADYKPTLGSITFAHSTDTVYVATAIGDTTTYLKGKSKVTFTVPATMATGTTRASTRVQFAGTDQTVTGTGTSVTTALLSEFGTKAYTVRVTDARGRWAETTAGSIIIRDYSNPVTVSTSIFRTTDASSVIQDPLGTFMRTGYSATCTPVTNSSSSNRNWVRIIVDVRTLPGGSFGSAIISTSATAGTHSIAATENYSTYAIDSSYEVRFRVYDAFSNGVYQQTLRILPLGEVSIMLGTNKMSIGKIWTQGTLDVGGDIYANGNKVLTNLDPANGSIIVDTRTLPESGSSSSYLPTPTNIDDKKTTPLFTMGFGGSSWRSGLILKGWSGSTYVAWSISGPAGTSTDEDYYLQSGVGSSWGTSRLIWHNGNLTPLTLGTTSSTAYRGDYGNTMYGVRLSASSIANTGYVRFANGWQVCWGSDSWTATINTSWGGGFTSGATYRTASFSATFAALPGFAASQNSSYSASVFLTNLATNSFQYFLWRGTSVGSTTYTTHYVAVGRY